METVINSPGIKEKAIKTVIWLSWFTIVYNIAEGLISIFFGIEEVSVSLLGFGVDSFIETFSAMIVLWRFKKEALHEAGISAEREKKASLSIGSLFLALAGFTALFSLFQLFSGKHPETTLPGTIISLVSLSFMFFLWFQKKKYGTILQSSTVLNDAACSMACIKLSFILLAGSAIFYAAPSLWWADSVAALVMSFFIFKEGREIRESAQKNEIGCGCH